tara:strand:+ start:137 stop:574 length:438 start_codon:yes stop_codon:yes gene_type:complete
MTWKYPELLGFINSRTIKSLKPIYVSKNSLHETNSYLDSLKNNKLLIGYLIESTTGLVTDSSLCIFRFSNELLDINLFKKLLKEHSSRICIIDTYSDSWGEKKVFLGKQIIREWTDDYLMDNNMNNEIYLNKLRDLSIRIRVNIL